MTKTWPRIRIGVPRFGALFCFDETESTRAQAEAASFGAIVMDSLRTVGA